MQRMCAPDIQRPLQDDGGHVGGGCIAGQDGPQEEHRRDVVHIGGRLVCSHLRSTQGMHLLSPEATQKPTRNQTFGQRDHAAVTMPAHSV